MTAPDPAALIARLHALPAAEAVTAAIAGDEPEVWLVGGAVRDLWLDEPPQDLDLVIVGDVEALAARLGAARSHERFGTANVVGPGGTRYDLARARRETYRAPGALPDVEPASIAEDLARRDFTVNALALALSGPRRGELATVPHGAEDLAAGRLRVLHPASFRDDPTRLLRLARYAARLGFVVEPETAELARAALAGGALATVTGPRVGRELELLAEEPDPVAAFAALRTLGIDAAVAPGFGLAVDDDALARRALVELPADGDPVAVVLGLVARGLGDGQTPRLLIDQLGIAAARREAALAVLRAPRLAAGLRGARRPSRVDAVIGGAPVEAIAVAAAVVGDSDAAAAGRAREWLRDWRHTTLQITGTDLIAAGIPEGPRIATGLRAARAARLDGHAGDREAQLAEALRTAG